MDDAGRLVQEIAGLADVLPGADARPLGGVTQAQAHAKPVPLCGARQVMTLTEHELVRQVMTLVRQVMTLALAPAECESARTCARVRERFLCKGTRTRAHTCAASARNWQLPSPKPFSSTSTRPTARTDGRRVHRAPGRRHMHVEDMSFRDATAYRLFDCKCVNIHGCFARPSGFATCGSPMRTNYGRGERKYHQREPTACWLAHI